MRESGRTINIMVKAATKMRRLVRPTKGSSHMANSMVRVH
jgi:hypothetical protein